VVVPEVLIFSYMVLLLLLPFVAGARTAFPVLFLAVLLVLLLRTRLGLTLVLLSWAEMNAGLMRKLNERDAEIAKLKAQLNDHIRNDKL